MKIVLAKLFVALLSAFVKTDRKMIFFSSYSGLRYDDSPKIIYEYLILDDRFRDFKYVWEFKEPDNFDLPEAKKVKHGSLKYIFYATKAGIWVSNKNNHRFNKKTFYLNTWHGTALKKMGEDIENKKNSLKNKHSNDYKIDILCAQGEFDADILSRYLGVDRSRTIICGLPRNDILVNYTADDKKKIKHKLSLPDKKVILYCPTFRDYDITGDGSGYISKPPINFVKWEEQLGEDYVVLYRNHYFITESIDITFNNFLHNCTNYEYLNDLMIVSDILISDYSSIYIDYSIMEKPMLCLAYDYDEYMQNRGMYIDIRKELPCEVAYDEDELLEQIMSMDYEQLSERTRQFKRRFVQECGNASKICADIIIENAEKI